MINIINLSNSFIIDAEGVKYQFPRGSVIAIKSDASDTVDLKGTATRKTVISIDAKATSYADADELLAALESMQ
jgi:hypothetical protein